MTNFFFPGRASTMNLENRMDYDDKPRKTPSIHFNRRLNKRQNQSIATELEPSAENWQRQTISQAGRLPNVERIS